MREKTLSVILFLAGVPVTFHGLGAVFLLPSFSDADFWRWQVPYGALFGAVGIGLLSVAGWLWNRTSGGTVKMWVSLANTYAYAVVGMVVEVILLQVVPHVLHIGG
jgi:hypothetical protein